MTMQTITTATLILQPVQPDHAPLLFPDLGDPWVYRYLDEPAPHSVDELRARFERFESECHGQERVLTWVFGPLSHKPVGYVRARFVLQDNGASISYVLSSQHRGHGYALLATEALIDHLRAEFGISRFWAAVAPQNMQAIRLLKRLAFHPMTGEGVCLPNVTGKLLFSL